MQPSADDIQLRSVRVLEALAGMEQPAPLEAIARRAGLPRTKAYRTLRALELDGFVSHLPRSGYRAAARALSLSLLLGPRPILRQRSAAVLHRLSATTATSATVYLRSGEHRVLLLMVHPAHDARIDIAMGERAPLTSGCVGTAILAWLPAPERDAIVAGSARGHARPRIGELERIRRTGYALSRNANHADIGGIAAPLLDPSDGTPLGSIGLGAPAEKLTDADLLALSGPLLRACADLAPQLASLIGRHGWIRQEALDIGMLADIEL